ncbi:hypothetical protein P3S68_006963 [Capsicum galapagoense]
MKILNSLIKSVADFIYGSKIKKGENPGESPNFYDFDTESDKSYNDGFFLCEAMGVLRK